MKKFILFLSVLFTAHHFSSQTFPDQEWKHTLSPSFQGWNQEGLENLREYVVDSTQITGMMVIHNGKVIFEYGNTSENSYIASCRKSIMAVLYGKYVKNGTINLNENLRQLNTQEDLLEIEKNATIKDIISARSGIFLPASNPGDLSNLAPKRGSVKPGSFWLYNNWDFNMAGDIFEKKTGKNIYDEIESQLATPLKMQDWNRKIQEKSGDMVVSDIPAYHIWLSARDMARIGLLLLNKGKWNNQQVLDAGWITEMTTPHTTYEEINKIAPFFNKDGIKYSYGYMWWLITNPENEKLQGAYNASGAFGQYLTVYPKTNTVLVIKTNDIYERQKGNLNYILKEIPNLYNADDEKKNKLLLTDLESNNIISFTERFKKTIPEKEQKNYKNLLNELGYKYLNEKAFENALKIFKLNIEINPTESDVYDSYGECYFLKKDYSNALSNYEKALKFMSDKNSKNSERVKFIIERIKKLAK